LMILSIEEILRNSLLLVTIEVPNLPARPVRPERCVYVSISSGS
jgi:hypothetical protein